MQDAASAQQVGSRDVLQARLCSRRRAAEKVLVVVLVVPGYAWVVSPGGKQAGGDVVGSDSCLSVALSVV
jgi:hypothetical protein